MSLALSYPVPSAGSIDQYIQSVNRIPMLTEQEEVSLATRLREEGDVDAARRLVMSHVRLVLFAMHWIKAEIHEYIVKNWRLVKIATTKAQRKLFFNLRGMKQDTATLQPAEVRS